MLKRDCDGHLSLDCQELKPEPSVWSWIVKIVCLIAAAYFAIHLLYYGIEQHQIAKKKQHRSGFSFTGQEQSSGHGYYLRRHDRGRQ